MGTPNKDIVIKDDAPSELLLDKHLNFLVSYSERKDDYEYVVTGKLGCSWHLGRLVLALSFHELVLHFRTNPIPDRQNTCV